MRVLKRFYLQKNGNHNRECRNTFFIRERNFRVIPLGASKETTAIELIL